MKTTDEKEIFGFGHFTSKPFWKVDPPMPIAPRKMGYRENGFHHKINTHGVMARKSSRTRKQGIPNNAQQSRQPRSQGDRNPEWKSSLRIEHGRGIGTMPKKLHGRGICPHAVMIFRLCANMA